METTQAELIAKLRRRRYRDIDERLLTDWRSKHLMPELDDHGRGQALGKDYVWTERNLVERAIAVHNLLNSNQPAESVLVAIWLRGYSASLSAVRAAWLGRLRMIETRLARRVETTGKQEDVLSKTAESVARNFSRSEGIERAKIEIPIVEFMGSLFDPGYIFAEEANQTFADGLLPFLAVRESSPAIRYLATKFDFAAIIGFFSATASLSATQNIIASASDGEFERARQLWLPIWKTVLELAPRLKRRRRKELLTLADQWSFAAGRHTLPVLLHLIRNGREREVERSLSAVSACAGKCNLGEALSALMNGGEMIKPLGELISELEAIWGKFDIGPA